MITRLPNVDLIGRDRVSCDALSMRYVVPVMVSGQALQLSALKSRAGKLMLDASAWCHWEGGDLTSRGASILLIKLEVHMFRGNFY